MPRTLGRLLTQLDEAISVLGYGREYYAVRMAAAMRLESYDVYSEQVRERKDRARSMRFKTACATLIGLRKKVVAGIFAGRALTPDEWNAALDACPGGSETELPPLGANGRKGSGNTTQGATGADVTS